MEQMRPEGIVFSDALSDAETRTAAIHELLVAVSPDILRERVETAEVGVAQAKGDGLHTRMGKVDRPFIKLGTVAVLWHSASMDGLDEIHEYMQRRNLEEVALGDAPDTYDLQKEYYLGEVLSLRKGMGAEQRDQLDAAARQYDEAHQELRALESTQDYRAALVGREVGKLSKPRRWFATVAAGLLFGVGAGVAIQEAAPNPAVPTYSSESTERIRKAQADGRAVSVYLGGTATSLMAAAVAMNYGDRKRYRIAQYRVQRKQK
jgi:hypothetical protein